LGARPVERTVLYAVDEFYSDLPREEKDDAQAPLLSLAGCPAKSVKEKDGFRIWHTDSTIPYYSNLLLVAYNRHLVRKLGQNNRSSISWKRGLDWRGVADVLAFRSRATGDIADPFDKKDVIWPFECGAWSGETMACILLDALISSGGRSAKVTTLIQRACAGRTREKTRQVLTGLARLFGRSFRGWVMENRKGRERWERQYRNRLVPNAAVYVCWYSQLRELVEDHPDLALELSVAALPGGGVKGDWYLGMATGSVSTSLGINVLDILCGQDEDYKRFVRGVGLPVRKKHETSTFVAWPNASDANSLRSILEIHKRALSRSKVEGYQKSRAALGTLGTQLARLRDSEIGRFVNSLLGRLGSMVETLTS
jgi:hypothetical protein